MSPPQPHDAPLWPLGVYFVAVILIVLGMLIFSYFLGQRQKVRSTGPYEGGILPTALARLRMSAHFYLMAMFFVIFDLEAVFIYSWAVAARELGWSGYISISIFIGVLAATLVYLWRLGALDTGSPTRKREAIRQA